MSHQPPLEAQATVGLQHFISPIPRSADLANLGADLLAKSPAGPSRFFCGFPGDFQPAQPASSSSLCHSSGEQIALRILLSTEHPGNERRRPSSTTATKVARWTCTGQRPTRSASSTETDPRSFASESPTPSPEPTPNRTTTPESRSTPTQYTTSEEQEEDRTSTRRPRRHVREFEEQDRSVGGRRDSRGGRGAEVWYVLRDLYAIQCLGSES